MLRGHPARRFTIGTIVGILLVVGWIGLKVFRVVNRITGETVENKLVTLDPDGTYGGSVEVKGSYSYTFEVTAIDGPCRMGVTHLTSSKGEPSFEDVARLAGGSLAVKPGETQRLTGTFKNAKYAWIVFNELDDKPVKVRINFRANEK